MEFYQSQLSDQDFARLSQFISANFGIKMPETKRNMLQSRLQKRLKENHLECFKSYCDFLFSGKGGADEVIHMIDMVSTNKTDFFREAAHFEFLKTVLLPDYLTQYPSRPLKVWSAGCSSGEEVYTIAMVVNEFAEEGKHLSYSILGTDISTRILDRAIRAIYQEDKVAHLPAELKKKYLLRSIDREKKEVRIVPNLRHKATFQRLNFIHPSYAVPKDFDVIFCRNVLIYFDKEVQEQVIYKLCGHLQPNGYLFLGHSESIMGMKVPLKQIRPTIYQKVDAN